MNIEKLKAELFSRLRRMEVPEDEADILADNFVYIELPKLLAKDPGIEKKGEAEAFRIIHDYFEKAVVQRAKAEAEFKWGAKPIGAEKELGEVNPEKVRAELPWDVKPPVMKPGEIDPAEIGGPRGQHDMPPLRTFNGDIMREAELKGAYCIGLEWADYKQSVPHLIIQHVLDNMSRGKVHWMEAFEIIMIALGELDDIHTPKREEQRLSEYQMREWKKQKSETEEALAEAARRVHDARVAFSREKSEQA